MQIIYNYKKNAVIASGFTSVLKLLEMKSDLACKVHARRCVKLLKVRYQVRSCNLNLSGRISYTWLKRADDVVCGKEPGNDNLCPVVYNILSAGLPSFEFTKWQSKRERDTIDQLQPVNLKQYFISPSIILRLRCS